MKAKIHQHIGKIHRGRKMKFLLGSQFDATRLDLSGDEFEMARRAFYANQNLLALEEKYFLILQNYAEFERHLHELALAGLLFGVKKWTEHVNDIQMINGRLLNLLSSTTAYLEQVPQHLNEIFGDACEQSAAFKQATSDEFDNSFGYRVMCAIRNHVQHQDFPVQWVEIGGQWETDGETRTFCRNHATAFISVSDLIENSRIRAATRKELRELGDEKLNVKVVVRQFLSSMARLHIHVRQNVAVIAKRNKEIIRELIGRFDACGQRKPAALSAISVNGDGAVAATFPVFVENIDRRNFLLRHCQVITDMERHSISGEV